MKLAVKRENVKFGVREKKRATRWQVVPRQMHCVAIRYETIWMIINKHFAFESYRLRGYEAARLQGCVGGIE